MTISSVSRSMSQIDGGLLASGLPTVPTKVVEQSSFVTMELQGASVSTVPTIWPVRQSNSATCWLSSITHVLKGPSTTSHLQNGEACAGTEATERTPREAASTVVLVAAFLHFLKPGFLITALSFRDDSRGSHSVFVTRATHPGLSDASQKMGRVAFRTNHSSAHTTNFHA